MKLFVAILCMVFSLQAKDKVHFITEVFPPYQITDDEKLTGGISVEIVRELQKNLGESSQIKFYPWARGYKLAKNKKNYALFSTLRTKEREKQFKWVGPIATMKLVFFKRADSTLELKTFEDAKNVRKIGVTYNVGNYEILKDKGFKNLDILKSGTDEVNIKKLVRGRIDLWPALMEAGVYNAKTMGYAGKIVPIKDIVIFQGDLYIAFCKKTDDAIIRKWQKALDTIKTNGVYERIIANYR